MNECVTRKGGPFRNPHRVRAYPQIATMLTGLNRSDSDLKERLSTFVSYLIDRLGTITSQEASGVIKLVG